MNRLPKKFWTNHGKCTRKYKMTAWNQEDKVWAMLPFLVSQFYRQSVKWPWNKRSWSNCMNPGKGGQLLIWSHENVTLHHSYWEQFGEQATQLKMCHCNALNYHSVWYIFSGTKVASLISYLWIKQCSFRAQY